MLNEFGDYEDRVVWKVTAITATSVRRTSHMRSPVQLSSNPQLSVPKDVHLLVQQAICIDWLSEVEKTPFGGGIWAHDMGLEKPMLANTLTREASRCCSSVVRLTCGRGNHGTRCDFQNHFRTSPSKQAAYLPVFQSRKVNSIKQRRGIRPLLNSQALWIGRVWVWKWLR